MALAVNLLISISGLIEKARLSDACQFPRTNQSRTLRTILNDAKDSQYGKEHHFEEIISSADDTELYELFKRYNPPTEFEHYRPYVKRMMEGESDVLFNGRQALFATTSGSTGEPKYIPISKKYLDNAYSKATRLWLSNFLTHRKRCFSGKMLTITGKRKEDTAPDGTIIGSVSGFTSHNAPSLIRHIYAVPAPVYDIDDYEARNYAIMRFALAQNVTIWIAPNPSTILEMQNTVDKWLDHIIEDIGNGTLCEELAIPQEIRQSLTGYLKPNPTRAFELRSLQSKYERVTPRRYWPNLQVLSTWKCGNTRIYLKKMEDFFRYDLFHQELGYFATECRAGLVFDSSDDSTPMPHLHFYEFRKEKDLLNPNAPFYRLWELKEGERYCPFVTTSSGLYRYNMNDIVQVGPQYRHTPKIHMVQKVNGIVSITGEKLYEDQFIKAVDSAQKETGMALSYYSGYVNLEESRYDWYFEFEDKKTKQATAEEFAAVVDTHLKELNIEYKSKRDSFRLKDPAVFLLRPNSFDKIKSFLMNRDKRDSSRFKPNVLAQNEGQHRLVARFAIKTRRR